MILSLYGDIRTDSPLGVEFTSLYLRIRVTAYGYQGGWFLRTNSGP